MVSREITTPSIGAVWQREILVQLTSSLIGLESVASNLQQVTNKFTCLAERKPFIRWLAVQ